ncbi:hypothetical sugar transporter family [Legionella pneumophila subsp. pneumophila str. Philadelphia 1]|uniref:Hypothetical sugar transporter family n=1 Tax=Legionella pneumophila subsp. pneumophila (strain Philadelphia 1 / ATCC 33152 / DSM 7513) TaxID=272624 RepID=Q5ZY63_LEGPH|nr:hypothetical sugar transporter family [Legionella pneumophila subsp. pneumophila str. Philadelphia 1]AEW50791.1 putative sugar transporter family [Legionella pneumophila subsp. pneumophila ATCC 43290]
MAHYLGLAHSNQLKISKIMLLQIVKTYLVVIIQFFFYCYQLGNIVIQMPEPCRVTTPLAMIVNRRSRRINSRTHDGFCHSRHPGYHYIIGQTNIRCKATCSTYNTIHSYLH